MNRKLLMEIVEENAALLQNLDVISNDIRDIENMLVSSNVKQSFCYILENKKEEIPSLTEKEPIIGEIPITGIEWSDNHCERWRLLYVLFDRSGVIVVRKPIGELAIDQRLQVYARLEEFLSAYKAYLARRKGIAQ
jgi:hypothetical protein